MVTAGNKADMSIIGMTANIAVSARKKRKKSIAVGARKKRKKNIAVDARRKRKIAVGVRKKRKKEIFGMMMMTTTGDSLII